MLSTFHFIIHCIYVIKSTVEKKSDEKSSTNTRFHHARVKQARANSAFWDGKGEVKKKSCTKRSKECSGATPTTYYKLYSISIHTFSLSTVSGCAFFCCHTRAQFQLHLIPINLGSYGFPSQPRFSPFALHYVFLMNALNEKERILIDLWFVSVAGYQNAINLLWASFARVYLRQLKSQGLYQRSELTPFLSCIISFAFHSHPQWKIDCSPRTTQLFVEHPATTLVCEIKKLRLQFHGRRNASERHSSYRCCICMCCTSSDRQDKVRKK